MDKNEMDVSAIAKAAWDEAWHMAYNDGVGAGHPLGRSFLDCDKEWADSDVVSRIAALAAPIASAQQAEPVAHVPVHPRNGPLWMDTIPLGSEVHRSNRYPLMALYAAPAPSASPAALTERESFEAAYRGICGLQGRDLESEFDRDEAGNYIYAGAAEAWRVWSARAALAVALTDERAAFEAWAKERTYNLGQLGGVYAVMRTTCAWDGWLGRAQRAASPAALTDYSYQQLFDAISAATKVTSGTEHIAISVSAFRSTLLAASPADQGEDARDAARYRWLRDHESWEPFDSKFLNAHDLYGRDSADMDNAIDDAMSASKEGA